MGISSLISSYNFVYFLLLLVGILIGLSIYFAVSVIRQRRHLLHHQLWFETIPDPVFLLDQQDMIVLFNPAALKVIWLPLEKVKHHH